MNTRFKLYFFTGLFCLLLPTSAFANAIWVWPSLYLAGAMILWAIPVGLLVETVIFIFILAYRPPKQTFFVLSLYAFFVILWVNLHSFLVGALAAAVVGLFGMLIVVFGFYTFPAITSIELHDDTIYFSIWPLTILSAAHVSYWVEKKILEKTFQVTLSQREQILFSAANLLSTLVAYLAIPLEQQ